MATAATRDVNHSTAARMYTTLPEWTWGAQHALYASNAAISGSPSHAPYSQPFNNGYDIKASALHGQRYSAAYNACNATIADGQFQISIYVMSVALDIALSGSTAQGRWTRDFYPHNFTQPTFMVSGQSLNQGEYGKLCEFIHQAQQKAVFDGDKHLTQVYIRGGSYPRGDRSMTVYDGSRSVGSGVSSSTDGKLPNQIIKGTHSDIIAKGYITSIARHHQKGVVAPTWSFGVTVAHMIAGPYADNKQFTLVKGNDWVNMLQDTQAESGTISTTSDMKSTNATYLAAAKKNSANVFSSPTSST